MAQALTWGIVTTIKAPLPAIKRFAAHHLELGAHRIYIYLDDPDPEIHAALNAHPKLRIVSCDARYWQKRGKERPAKHQPRQSLNAMHAYQRRTEVDWLIHIDVDEFLWPETPLVDALGALPQSCLCTRVRPVEALSNEGVADAVGGTTWFKAFSVNPTQRKRETDAIYPTFGRYLNGGFLSHVEGKLFFRTGLDGLRIKIHNVFLGADKNPGELPIPGADLCHMHAPDWRDWQDSFDFRHQNGSYRAELKPARRRESGGLTMHELFKTIRAHDGEDGLRQFYDEVCVATPDLRQRLAAHGLLRQRKLDLDHKVSIHFS